MAWKPELALGPAWGFSLLIAMLHGLAAWTLVKAGWGGVAPLVVALGIYQVLLQGLKRMPWSVRHVWLEPDGWFLKFQNGRRAGPFLLTASSRLDAGFIRLSLKSKGRVFPRHLLLTPAMTGADSFRRLQLFLRWAPEKNQPVAT